MSKIKVNTLESDENLKLTPNGTGVVEVKGAGGADGTLQLTSGSNSQVKIKSPPHSAGQSYTLVLPDNAITTDKFLKVKSVTGSGSTQVGQLEYATPSMPDTNNLNASNLTSGTIPAARFPSSFTASDAALTLEAKLTISTPVVNVQQTISEGMYWIVAKNFCTNVTGYGGPAIEMIDANGSQHYNRFNHYYRNYSQSQNNYQLSLYNETYDPYTYAFEMLFSNVSRPWLYGRGLCPGRTNGAWEVFNYAANTATAVTMNFRVYSGHTILPTTQILFYKFKES